MGSNMLGGEADILLPPKKRLFHLRKPLSSPKLPSSPNQEKLDTPSSSNREFQQGNVDSSSQPRESSSSDLSAKKSLLGTASDDTFVAGSDGKSCGLKIANPEKCNVSRVHECIPTVDVGSDSGKQKCEEQPPNDKGSSQLAMETMESKSTVMKSVVTTSTTSDDFSFQNSKALSVEKKSDSYFREPLVAQGSLDGCGATDASIADSTQSSANRLGWDLNTMMDTWDGSSKNKPMDHAKVEKLAHDVSGLDVMKHEACSLSLADGVIRGGTHVANDKSPQLQKFTIFSDVHQSSDPHSDLHRTAGSGISSQSTQSMISVFKSPTVVKNFSDLNLTIKPPSTSENLKMTISKKIKCEPDVINNEISEMQVGNHNLELVRCKTVKVGAHEESGQVGKQFVAGSDDDTTFPVKSEEKSCPTSIDTLGETSICKKESIDSEDLSKVADAIFKLPAVQNAVSYVLQLKTPCATLLSTTEELVKPNLCTPENSGYASQQINDGGVADDVISKGPASMIVSIDDKISDATANTEQKESKYPMGVGLPVLSTEIVLENPGPASNATICHGNLVDSSGKEELDRSAIAEESSTPSGFTEEKPEKNDATDSSGKEELDRTACAQESSTPSGFTEEQPEKNNAMDSSEKELDGSTFAEEFSTPGFSEVKSEKNHATDSSGKEELDRSSLAEKFFTPSGFPEVKSEMKIVADAYDAKEAMQTIISGEPHDDDMEDGEVRDMQHDAVQDPCERESDLSTPAIPMTIVPHSDEKGALSQSTEEKEVAHHSDDMDMDTTKEVISGDNEKEVAQMIVFNKQRCLETNPMSDKSPSESDDTLTKGSEGDVANEKTEAVGSELLPENQLLHQNLELFTNDEDGEHLVENITHNTGSQSIAISKGTVSEISKCVPMKTISSQIEKESSNDKPAQEETRRWSRDESYREIQRHGRDRDQRDSARKSGYEFYPSRRRFRDDFEGSHGERSPGSGYDTMHFHNSTNYRYPRHKNASDSSFAVGSDACVGSSGRAGRQLRNDKSENFEHRPSRRLSPRGREGRTLVSEQMVQRPRRGIDPGGSNDYERVGNTYMRRGRRSISPDQRRAYLARRYSPTSIGRDRLHSHVWPPKRLPDGFDGHPELIPHVSPRSLRVERLGSPGRREIFPGDLSSRRRGSPLYVSHLRDGMRDVGPIDEYDCPIPAGSLQRNVPRYHLVDPRLNTEDRQFGHVRHRRFNEMLVDGDDEERNYWRGMVRPMPQRYHPTGGENERTFPFHPEQAPRRNIPLPTETEGEFPERRNSRDQPIRSRQGDIPYRLREVEEGDYHLESGEQDSHASNETHTKRRRY